MTAGPLTRQVCAVLGATHFRYANELQLHESIAARLNVAGIPVADTDREVKLNATDRPDFLLGGLCVEVKVDGDTRAVWRQLTRYAAHDRVTELLLVTTRARHLRGAPTVLNGKPVTVMLIRGGLV